MTFPKTQTEELNGYIQDLESLTARVSSVQTPVVPEFTAQANSWMAQVRGLDAEALTIEQMCAVTDSYLTISSVGESIKSGGTNG